MNTGMFGVGWGQQSHTCLCVARAGVDPLSGLSILSSVRGVSDGRGAAGVLLAASSSASRAVAFSAERVTCALKPSGVTLTCDKWAIRNERNKTAEIYCWHRLKPENATTLQDTSYQTA